MLTKATSEHAFMGLQTEQLDPAAFGYRSDAGYEPKDLPVGMPASPIDAVVVCCHCARALTHAVDLAAELGCPLFVYHDIPAGVPNDQARAAAMWSLSTPRFDEVRTFYFPLYRNEPKPWPRLRTRSHRLSQRVVHGGLSDLRTKAMADVHLAGYRRILMLDDDISVDPALVHAASRAMDREGYTAVGFRINDVADKAVFDHIFSLDRRLDLEVFKEQHWVRPPSGGAVLVDPSRAIAHSPPIYGEDWVVFHELLRRGFRIAVMGEARQHNGRRFNDSRIRAEAAGEIFSEGLSFAVNKNNQPLHQDMWRRILNVRLAKLVMLRHLIDIIEDRARLSEQEPGLSGGNSPLKNRDEVVRVISVLERCFKTLKPQKFIDFYQQWWDDERTFQSWLREQEPSSLELPENEMQYIEPADMVVNG